MERLFNLSRTWKQVLMLSADLAVIALSYYMAYALRLRDYIEPFTQGASVYLVLFIIMAATCGLFALLGVYRAVLHRISGRTVNIHHCPFLKGQLPFRRNHFE